MNNNDILRKTLEAMAADAEVNGKTTLDFIDVNVLVDGFKRLEPKEGGQGEKIVPIDSPLADTVEGMLHPDYKERFKAEYHQTKIRYEKLKAFCNKIEAADRTRIAPFAPKKVEEPEHDCPVEVLREQQSAMGQYLHILEIRAVIEGIEL